MIPPTPTPTPVHAADPPAPPSSSLDSQPAAGIAADSGRPPHLAEPSAEFLSLIPHEFARRHLILSDGEREGAELLLVAPATAPLAVFNVGVRLGRRTRTTPAAAEEIAAAIDRAFSRRQSSGEHEAQAGTSIQLNGTPGYAEELEAVVRDAERDLLSTHGKAPTVRLVDLVLFEALMRGASDVHVQPVRGRTLVRYRLDGVLHTARELPGSLASAVVSRIKVMARLDVAEQRSPQDGRATVTVGGTGEPSNGRPDHSPPRRVDLRVSTLPSTYGERVVLRLLDPARSPHLKSFRALGMPPAMERAYLEQASKTSGIVLSTGPTGSGKTTTLYATLAWLCASNSGADRGGCELNVMTVEDPVEYDLSDGGAAGAGLAISQTQVDPKKNVTFATGLRHILRQDPDVIMVGEIRDDETARIAVQASLTGHLVLSTLHTNDAASAIARLLDLGVEPFLVSSSLSAVLAQRLVRRLHAPCAGKGCHGEGGCLGTGFRGRTGVFELLVLDRGIRDLVGRRSSAVEIKEEARRKGMITLREAGGTLIAEGITTEEEVTRVIEAVGDQS
jgi:general secretion pathway protein E